GAGWGSFLSGAAGALRRFRGPSSWGLGGATGGRRRAPRIAARRAAPPGVGAPPRACHTRYRSTPPVQAPCYTRRTSPSAASRSLRRTWPARGCLVALLALHLLDDLGGLEQHGRRNGEAERLGGLEV